MLGALSRCSLTNPQSMSEVGGVTVTSATEMTLRQAETASQRARIRIHAGGGPGVKVQIFLALKKLLIV